MQGRLQTIRQNRLAAVVAFVISAAGALGIAFLALGGGDETSIAAPADTPAPTATATASATATAVPTPDASETPIAHPGLLDGVPMTDEEWTARKDHLPLAVMIDNTTGAYPHAGLDRADLVYEAFVEGGITRLMAVYWRQDAEKIMPVRSARTPFAIWVSEIAALYGHAGGATTDNDANALGQIREWGIRDLEAFAPVSSNYYYRDGERRAPYDLATSTAALRQAAAELGLDGPPVVEPWKFREPGTLLPPGEPAGGLEIDFSGRLYSWQYIQWHWDPAAKRYLRYQFGGPHVDATSGDQLAFATVIVMKADARVIDEPGHVVYEQLGSGPVTVFTGGRAYAGTWNKEKREDRTRFIDAQGAEITFERGPIFVELLAQQSAFGFVANPRDLREMPAFEPPPPGSPPPETEVPAETPTLLPTVTPRLGSPTPTRTLPPTHTPVPSNTPTPTVTPEPVVTEPPPGKLPD